MDFWDLTKVVFRRWYVSVPLLLLTGGACVWVAAFVEPNYKATTYVTLIPPQEPASPEESLRNPYLSLGLGTLSQSAATVTQDMRFLESLVERGLTDNVAVELNFPLPIATIEAVGGTEEQATRTLDAVVTRYSDAVLSLQQDADAAPNSLIRPQRLDGGGIEEEGGKVKRAFIGVAGAGVILTVAASVAVDALIRRRRWRPDLDKLLTGPIPTSPPPTGVVVGAVPSAPAPATVPADSGAGSVTAHEPPTADIQAGRMPDSTIVLPKVQNTSGRPGRDKGRPRR